VREYTAPVAHLPAARTGPAPGPVGAGAALLLAVGAWLFPAQDPAPDRVDWSSIDTIVTRIEAPRVPERIYRVADFGATGDGRTDARPAIMAAIDTASGDGGGRVQLSPGVWLSRVLGYSPLVYARDVEDVAITGPGTR